MTPDPTSNTHAQLAEFLRLNPDATAIEAVGHVGADPDRWVDVVEDALATADPPATLRNAETAGTEPDPARSNPGGNADASPSATPDPDGRTDTADAPAGWGDADFTTTHPDTYPPETDERVKWMGAVGKQAFAPWGDREHPEADPDEDARWKWGLEENHTDGDAVDRWVDMDPRLDGRAFIQLESDPFAFVDGDDVRDPDTGEVHPAFRALLEHLGATYADVSTSGTGVHATYLGDLPRDLPEAKWQIDTEPWGANDEPPKIEIYANTHLAISHGDHVAGTPLEVNGWNDDALRAILDANGKLPDPSPSTARDDYNLDDYEPTATTADETTDDIRDIFRALDRLDPKRVGERTIVREWTRDRRSFLPVWGSSDDNGTANYIDERIWHDTGHDGGYGGPVVMAAIDAGVINHTGADPSDVRGEAFFEAVDHLRDLGFSIPELENPTADPDTEPTAVLPPSVRDLATAASGWDWQHAGQDTDLTIDAARDRTADAIADAYGSGGRVLIEALPTMGKSYGSVLAAARTGEPVTILTGRGRKEQYEQLREWCDALGLEHYTLPSFTRDCETANGEHGEEWADTVHGWYARGATPKAIHKHAEEVLGRPLPCQAQDGHRCSYAAKWDFDPDTDGSADLEEDAPIDVLIGHYAHAHKPKVTTGRTVVFDEFPGGAYETALAESGDLQRAVSCWLGTVDAIPFDTYTDLVENRRDEGRRADALLWFDDHGIDADETHVFDDDHAHAAAPLAVFSLLAGEDLGNGYERADLGDGIRAVFDRSTGAVSVLRPPALEYASGIVALDGTPTKRMWELALGERLNHRPILADAERAEYVRDALNLNLVRTTEYVKPYNSPDHVNTREDAALLEKVAEQHGERPGVITSTTALGEYDAAGVLDPDRDDHGALTGDVSHGPADAVRWYGNVLGSNKFKEKRVLVVIGSHHYGDGFIKKWGAYAGEAVERDGDGKGADLSYTGIGDEILTHMREHTTLQAAMRAGRDGNGAVVYVHTNTLPDWVPIAGEGRVTRTYGEGERHVLTAGEELEEWRTKEIAEHPAVDVGERQVFNILNRLAERDDTPIGRELDGRGYVWRDDGIHELNEHGEVTLDPVDLGDADEETVREIARSSIYTWDFLNGDGDPDGAPVEPPGGSIPTAIDAVAEGDTPPDPGD